MAGSGLRIAMLAPFGIRPKGTLSARMLPLAQALVRRSHRVAIIAPPVQNPEDAGTSVTYNGVPVTHIALSPLPGPAHVAQQVVALCGAVRAEQPDIVHLFKPKGYSGLAALLLRAWMPRTPLVVDTDDWEGWGGWNDLLPYPRAAKQLFSWQERNLPRRAAAVTVVSRTLETQVRGFGVPSERIFYLPNGMMNAPEPRAQRFTAAPPTILLYTRFWEFDVRDVVAVLAGIVAGRPDARLLVVGKGEQGEEQELLRLAERAGLGAAIDYRGWTEPARLPDVLGSADVALVPMDNTLINRARGLAKLLELMALGLPIVASRVGQVDEYLASGECGWLVPPGDPGALARGVLALLSDPGLAFQLGLRAQQRAWDEYSWDRLALVAEHAYQRAHVL